MLLKILDPNLNWVSLITQNLGIFKKKRGRGRRLRRTPQFPPPQNNLFNFSRYGLTIRATKHSKSYPTTEGITMQSFKSTE